VGFEVTERLNTRPAISSSAAAVSLRDSSRSKRRADDRRSGRPLSTCRTPARRAGHGEDRSLRGWGHVTQARSTMLLRRPRDRHRQRRARDGQLSSPTPWLTNARRFPTPRIVRRAQCTGASITRSSITSRLDWPSGKRSQRSTARPGPPSWRCGRGFRAISRRPAQPSRSSATTYRAGLASRWVDTPWAEASTHHSDATLGPPSGCLCEIHMHALAQGFAQGTAFLWSRTGNTARHRQSVDRRKALEHRDPLGVRVRLV